MKMNTSTAYLHFHTYIILSSNCHKIVSNSLGHIYCSLLPLDAITFVNVTTRKKICLLYIWWTQCRWNLCNMHLANNFKLTHTTEFSFTQSARHSCRDGAFSKPRFHSVSSVWYNCGNCFCFLPARPTKISIPLWFRL